MYESKRQIESLLGLEIVTVPRRIDFDTYLFERGGMLRKGANDCSRKMKRANLMRHVRAVCKMSVLDEPLGGHDKAEINLGFNAGEQQRADDFTERNERHWCHWRYPLLERDIEREQTWDIYRKAGFTILVGMYEKMGRFDCFWCPNQTTVQARAVINHYPALAEEWAAAEKRKGHSFRRMPMKVLMDRERNNLFAGCDDERSTGCSCFGGTDDVWSDDEPRPVEA